MPNVGILVQPTKLMKFSKSHNIKILNNLLLPINIFEEYKNQDGFHLQNGPRKFIYNFRGSFHIRAFS